MAVRIRMKKMGRAHRHFFRICAIDKHSPRDGKVLEELGTYDPMIANTDARTQLKSERIDYWIGVGAKPSDKCAILIKKYGTNGTHLDAQRSALEQLTMPTAMPDPGEPASMPKSAEEEKAPEAKTEEKPATEEKAATEEKPAEAEKPVEEKAAEKAPVEEAKAEEAVKEEKSE